MNVSETKIDRSYPDSQFLIPGYYLHRNDRKKGGGAVLLFVSFKILSKRVTFDMCYKTIEPFALEIGLKSRNAIILVIYRPPKKLTGKYRLLLEEELNHIANWARLQYPMVIITGDLNLNRMEPSSPEGELLLDLEVEQGLVSGPCFWTWRKVVVEAYALHQVALLKASGCRVYRCYFPTKRDDLFLSNSPGTFANNRFRMTFSGLTWCYPVG